MSEKDLDLDKNVLEGPGTALEKQLVADYLREKGYRMVDLKKLPEDKAKILMQEACKYASLKLADIEAKSLFRKEIHPPI
jgi:hypothetical protein